MAESFYIDTKEIKSIRVKLDGLKKEIPAATASALNRTLDYTATQIGREVTKTYSIKASLVKKTLRKNRASKTKLNAYISSTGHTLSLANFPHSPKAPWKGGGAKPRSVTVKIKQGSNKQISTSPKAFIAPTGGGPDTVQYNVFRRTGEGRLPITVIRTLSVPQMIGEKDTINRIQKAAEKKLEERIKHEIEYRINKAAGGKASG